MMKSEEVSRRIKDLLERDLLRKVKETEGLNDIKIGCLRILDNLSRTPEEEEASKKLQDEINFLLEDMLK